jgi:hypothetical protein
LPFASVAQNEKKTKKEPIYLDVLFKELTSQQTTPATLPTFVKEYCQTLKM